MSGQHVGFNQYKTHHIYNPTGGLVVETVSK